MDALTKFDAFGWELNPFRMYFVPPRDESSGASATRDGGGRKARDNESGGWGAASDGQVPIDCR